MHEMTIVANVLEIAHRQAAGAGAARINRVVLEVGRLAGVGRDDAGRDSRDDGDHFKRVGRHRR